MTHHSEKNYVCIENHDELYYIWKDRGFKNVDIYHFDAHLDYRDEKDGGNIHKGNYLFFALKERIVKDLYWIVPGTLKDMMRHKTVLHHKLKSYGVRNFGIRDGYVHGTILDNKNLYIYTLENLPEITENPPVLDIDIDFFMFPTIINTDRLYDIGHRKPWIFPSEFIKKIHSVMQNFKMISICYSVEGGWTPMEYKYIGDELVNELGIRDEKTIFKLLAGQSFRKFSQYFRSRNIPKARKYFKTALSLNPDYNSLYNTYGPLYLLNGELDKAEQEFNVLLEIDNNNKFALFGLGLVSLVREDFRRAANYFKKIQKTDTNKEIPLFLIYAESMLNHTTKTKKILNQYLTQ